MKMNFSRVMAQVAQRYASQEALVNVERNRRYRKKRHKTRPTNL